MYEFIRLALRMRVGFKERTCFISAKRKALSHTRHVSVIIFVREFSVLRTNKNVITWKLLISCKFAKLDQFSLDKNFNTYAIYGKGTIQRTILFGRFGPRTFLTIRLPVRLLSELNALMKKKKKN